MTSAWYEVMYKSYPTLIIIVIYANPCVDRSQTQRRLEG